MAALVLEMEKAPASSKPGKADKMGDSDSLDEFEAALDDAFDAVKGGDREAFRDAMAAAVSAKCAEMYAAEEGEE